MGASTAVVADAISYAVSTVCLLLIRAPLEEPDANMPHAKQTLVADIREGLAFVWKENR